MSAHRKSRAEIEAEMAARLEDARWMAETGECLDGAARRLGLTVNTLEKFLERHDKAVLKALVDRQPRDHNRQVCDGINVWELTGLGDRRRRYARRRLEAA